MTIYPKDSQVRRWWMIILGKQALGLLPMCLLGSMMMILYFAFGVYGVRTEVIRRYAKKGRCSLIPFRYRSRPAYHAHLKALVPSVVELSHIPL